MYTKKIINQQMKIPMEYFNNKTIPSVYGTFQQQNVNTITRLLSGIVESWLRKTAESDGDQTSGWKRI